MHQDKGGIVKQYKIFKHPAGMTEAVKQGWSWPAFSFFPIWAMVKKMWGLGIGSLFLLLLLAAVDSGGGVGGEFALGLVGLIPYIIAGVYGNSWREKNLVSRGFEHVDAVTAANPDGALALYLKPATATR